MAVGIVVEYNPFHNGHIRQLNWIKSNFPNEKIIVVMSEKYSQRGEIIVVPYKVRVKFAKKYGVDQVLPLTFEETVQAAHIFAKNAIQKLYAAGVDKLVFGSESNDVTKMKQLAANIITHKATLDTKIKHYIKAEKLGYPKAYALATKDIFGEAFEQPNDILGMEYIKYILENNLPIDIFTIKRNVEFHSLETTEHYASATFLRALIKQKGDLSPFSPLPNKFRDRTDKFYRQFQKILTKTPIAKLQTIPLVSEGIENLLLKNVQIATYDKFVDTCTSKRYTRSKIKRIMAWIVEKKWAK
ncbi:nucleotidyltransferase [Mycoplasmopsis columbinasalis]|uniref:Protein of uncharacterized function (DUF795) n=1 Tax=Mycoplasmopsis columbinasalis TaxID=114880 RepID=A0A449BAV1_9BACT|nr:nucleotidyltransferase [Mycoplasmopsis columbinasalis]VEU78322.1 Protein of uncharacterised function (DUF795) [Mycoplasmopsis columbinasalis]